MCWLGSLQQNGVTCVCLESDNNDITATVAVYRCCLQSHQYNIYVNVVAGVTLPRGETLAGATSFYLVFIKAAGLSWACPGTPAKQVGIPFQDMFVAGPELSCSK
jgi:hypothetical protein